MAMLTLIDTYNGKVLYDKQYVGHIEFDKTTQRYDITSIRGCEYGKTFDEMVAYFHSYNWRNILGRCVSVEIKRKYEPHRVNVHKQRWSLR